MGEVEGADRIAAMTGTACLGRYADNWLPLVRGNRLYKLRAKALVVATGSLEQPLVFRNNDLPGVMLASAAQRLIKLYGVKPGRRAVVATVNDAGYGAALDLLDAGVEVAAVVDLRMEAQRTAMSDTLAARRVPIHAASAPWEAVPQRKGPRLARVRVARIEADGVCAPSVDSFSCDLLVVSGGQAPAAALLRQAGATFAYDSARHATTVADLPPASSPRARWPARPASMPRWRRAAAPAGRRPGLPASTQGPSLPRPPRRRQQPRDRKPRGRSSRTPTTRPSSISTRTCRSTTSKTPSPRATTTSSCSSASPPTAWAPRRAGIRR